MPSKLHAAPVNVGFDLTVIEREDGNFEVKIKLAGTVVWTERFREVADFVTLEREAPPANPEEAVNRALARFAHRLATTLAH